MSLYPPDVAVSLAGIPQGRGSKVFVVDYANGLDTNAGSKWSSPFKTVEKALSMCVAGRNDAILVVGNGTSVVTAAAIAAWKDFTHLVGMCGPLLVDQRSRIKCPAALATTPFFTFDADGCVVKNISFWHETSNAAGLVNFYLTGGRNYFENCQFAGGVGANAVTGARSLKIEGNDGGNLFKHCAIGLDTIMAVNGMAGLEFQGGAIHNKFEDCMFAVNTNGTTFAHVLVPAADDVNRWNWFDKCLFINEGDGVQASVFSIVAALATANKIFATDCWKYGATDWDHANNGLMTNIEVVANHSGVNTGNTLIVTSA